MPSWSPRVMLALALLTLGTSATAGSLAAPSPASDPGDHIDPPITLRDAVARALAHNPALTASAHAAEAAAWNLRQARGQLLPSLSLQTGYTRLDEETVSRANAFGREITMYFPDSSGALQPVTIEIPQTVFRHGYQTGLSADLLLFNPSVWNATSLAATARSLSLAQWEATRQATVHQTLRRFVDLLKIRSLTRIQRRSLTQAQENREQAERLLAIGRYAEADVLRWLVEEAQQKQLLLQQESTERVTALALENLMGEPPSGCTIPDTLLPNALVREIQRFRKADPATWDTFLSAPLDTLIAASPQLEILTAAVRTAEQEHQQSLIGFLPSVTVSGSYGWQTNDTFALDGDRTWSVSASLGLPLFTGFSNFSARQATKYRLLEARCAASDSRRALLLAAEAARTAIRSQAEQLRLAEISLVSASRNYEIRKNNFDLGRLSNLEWIDAHLALLSADQSRSAAYYDLILAIADYYQARGEIFSLMEHEGSTR